jgi:putative transposase
MRHGMHQPVSYKRHRYPPKIIAHAVWLHFRFPLSLRLVEELLAERGITVSYETIRCWAKKFGTQYARRLKRKRASQSDVWHLDEVVISIAGKKHWLWRAVDQDGNVLDEIDQSRRNTKAARRLLTRLLQKQGMRPKRIITDKLHSYSAARQQTMPLRKREPIMQRFRSVGAPQRFVSIFSAIRDLFVPPSAKRSSLQIHVHRSQAMEQWQVVIRAV